MGEVGQGAKIWEEISYNRTIAAELYKSLDISFSLAKILAQRGVDSSENAEKFLFPKLTYLGDPFKVHGVPEAVDLLQRVIEQKLMIAVVGDYDVDGITSITLLVNVLRHFGLNVDFFVPLRASEGHGLSRTIINRMLSRKEYRVAVVLDCGTNSVDEVRLLQDNGVEVLVVDHHPSKHFKIADCCIVNPQIDDSKNDNKNQILCTVGLVFKLCYALLKVLRKKGNKCAFEYSLKDDLDLVALGTIADMCQLVRDNRIFCKFGLKILNSKYRRPGIEALCRSANIPFNAVIRQQDVSFKLCPRLNACGRLSDASLPIHMMLSDDFDEAITYAYELDETNKDRQFIEREITVQAEDMVNRNYSDDPGLVLYAENWHTGVVGIVSGKFAKDFSRPCIVLGYESGLARGSGRSTNGVNLIDILEKCSDLLEEWGGHPYAVGISLLPSKVDAFRERFNEIVRETSIPVSFVEKLEYASELEIEYIDGNLIQDLELLQPFGQKNPEPLFLLKGVEIRDLPETFGSQKTHIKFWLNDRYSKRIMVIGWNASCNIPPIGTRIDMLITVNREKWSRTYSTCLNLIDWRLS